MKFIALSMLSLSSLLSGCASQDKTIALSLEQLGAEARSYEYGIGGSPSFLLQDKQFTRTSINITGLTVPVAVGELVSSPWSEVPETLAVPYRTGCSLIVETTFDTGLTDAEARKTVYGAAIALKGINEAAAVKASLEYRAEVAAYAVTYVSKIGEDAALKDEATLILAKAVGVTMPSAIPTGEKPILKAFSDARILASIDADEAVANYNKKIKDLDAAAAVPNLIITRWKATTDERQSGNLGGIGKGSRSAYLQRSGYVVLADIKITTLIPGDDLAHRIVQDREIEIGRTGSDTVFGKPSVVTYTLSAKHLSYVEDQNYSETISSSINLTADELTQTLGGDIGRLLKQQSAKFESTLQRNGAVGGQGLVSTPQRTVYRYNFAGDRNRYLATQAQSERMEEYNVVYSNRTTLERENKRVRGPLMADGSSFDPKSCGSELNTFQQPYDFADVPSIGDRKAREAETSDSRPKVSNGQLPAKKSSVVAKP